MLTRLICLTLLYMLMAVPSFGAGHFRDMAQDTKGNAMGNVQVTVYEAGTTNIVPLFTDVDGNNSKANPFLTGADGSIDFYIDNGTYDVVLTCDVCYGGRSYSFDPSRNLNITVLDSTGIAAGAQGLDANFDATDGNTITGASEARPFNLLGDTGQETSGWTMYRHSSGKSVLKCVEAGVVGDCHVYTELNANKKWGVKNSVGTAVLEFDSQLGKMSALAFDCRDGSIFCTVTDERHFPVATCQNTTASANFDLPTTNAPAPTCDTGSNTQKAYLAFDASTDEAFEDHWILPTGFLAVNVYFRWKAAATSGAVGWCVQFSRVPDGTTSDQAYSSQATANCVSDTAKGTTLQENAASILSATCSSCAAGDHVYVRISRDANGGAVTDDMSGDALLLNYGRAFVVTQ